MVWGRGVGLKVLGLGMEDDASRPAVYCWILIISRCGHCRLSDPFHPPENPKH